MFFKGSGGHNSGGSGSFHYPVTGSRVSILEMQMLPRFPKHIKCNLFKRNSPIKRPNKTPATQSCGRGTGVCVRAMAGSALLQGSPGVHRATYVIQSYSLLCVESQDRYYKAGIKLRVNR